MESNKRFHFTQSTKQTFNVYSYNEQDWQYLGNFGAKVRVSSTGKLVYIDNCSSNDLFEDIKSYCIAEKIIKNC